MANRHWVGGTATWDSTAASKWATTSGGAGGAAVPTAADEVFFDASSGAVTVTTSGTTTDVCRSLNFTGFTGTFNHAAATTVLIGDGTAGTGNIALKAVAGMTYTVGSNTTAIISFVSTSGTQQTIDSGGKTLPFLTFNGAGGSWAFASNIAIATASSAGISLLAGSLDTANFSLTCGLLSTSGSATRSLTLGSSALTLTANGNSGIQFSSVTGLTLNAGTSNILINNSNSGVTFGSNLTYYDVTVRYGNGSGVISGTGSTFNNLILEGTITSRLLMGNDFTADTLTVRSTPTGSVTSVPICLSSINGTQRTLTTTNTPTLTNVVFKDIVIAGPSSPYSTTFTGDGGNNGGMTLSTPRTLYWVDTNGGVYNATTSWSSSSGGGSGQNPPMPQDTVVFDANSITSGGSVITLTWQGMPTIDFTNVLNNPSVSFTNTNGFVMLFGDLILKSGMGASGTGGMGFLGTVDQEVDLAGVTIAGAISLFGNAGNTVRLLSDFATTTTIGVTGQGDAQDLGTFDANGFDVTCTTFTSSNSNTREVIMGSGQWTLTGSGATIWNFTTTTNLTFSRGSNPIICNYSGSTGTRTISAGGLAEGIAPDFDITAGSDIITLGSAHAVRHLDFSGFTGSWASTSQTIYGSLTLGSGMTVTEGGSVLTFAATGAQTITTNGVAICKPLTFDGVGGSWLLQDDLNMTGPNARAISVGNGTFDANGYDVTAYSVTSSNSNVRTVDLGSGTWTMIGTGTLFGLSVGTNATFVFNEGTVIIADTGAVDKTFHTGASRNWGTVEVTAGGAGRFIFNGSTVINNFIVNGPKTIRFNAGSTVTFTGWYVDGTAGNLVTIDSSSAGSAGIISKATGIVSSDYLSIRDSTATGGAIWYAGANSTNTSNNLGWKFKAPVINVHRGGFTTAH